MQSYMLWILTTLAHDQPPVEDRVHSDDLSHAQNPGQGVETQWVHHLRAGKQPLLEEPTANRAIWPKMKANLLLVHWGKVKVKLALLGEVKVKPIRVTRDSIKVRNPLVCLGKVPMFPGSLWTGREESLETGIRSLPRSHPAVPLQTRKIRRERFQSLQGQGQTLEER